MILISFQTRPFLLEFLTAASSRFELVVFTASPSLYGNKVIDMIDPGQSLISHRLFRNDCYYHQVTLTLTISLQDQSLQGRYVKDLEVLGRDLSKVAIIDNSVEAMGFQLENGILIDDFYSDPEDRGLVECLQFLEIMEKMRDCREAVQKYYQVTMK